MKLKRILSSISPARHPRLRGILFWCLFALLTAGTPWCAGAFFHAFDIPAFLAWTGVIALLASLAVSLFFRRALLAAALIEILLTAVFCLISPERRFRETVWQTPWRRTLEADRLDDGRYELRNVRDFLYRTENDYDIRYRTMTVDPERISSIDAVFSHWDNQESIAHSMLGLNFADGETVVISLETRLPEGASQNGIDGIYRRYGLAMLAGTPDDFYGLRVNHRGETLYVYRLLMDHPALRDTTVSILERAAELQRNPMFYNSLYRNCTTGLLPMLPGADQFLAGDIRVILNGLAVQMLYEKDLIARREDESFGSIRARSLVPGLCRGESAPPALYGGESEARWLRPSPTPTAQDVLSPQAGEDGRRNDGGGH
jgi:hypothetical protein